MTVENMSWSISTKECCHTRRESNRWPPDGQSNVHPTEPRRPADLLRWPAKTVKIFSCQDWSVSYSRFSNAGTDHFSYIFHIYLLWYFISNHSSGNLDDGYMVVYMWIFFFFFFDLGFTALSRIFHLYRADRSSKVGENRSTRRKTTWPSVSRTWLSHIWPELGSNHSGEKPNGLRVNSLIH